MLAVLRLLWACALAALLAGQAHAQAQSGFKEVPALQARVTDQAGMLTPDQRQRLEGVLADYEAQTGSQIAVLLVRSTEPEAIEQYGIRVADAWKLGRKGVDDGVLLLVARDNPKALRRLRIEAGRGVQGVLTDAQSKRILQDTIAPHFRQDDWYGGLVAGVGAIATLLNQEKFPAPKAQPAAQDDEVTGPGVITSIFLIFVAIAIVRSLFRRRPHLAQPGAGGTHGWDGATTGFILGSILSNMNNDRQRGGGFGGFGGGGSSHGGGFSGGGGSFDGGGASGDW
ncbi:YgcG family protein [uncultured Massilia sp.]|uniref:TPM domain-containing protein n=1 Tax=uncultured Massilia sp. TaxID=169973 RepID=UPI0025F3ACD7|nr:TPM domain-containing protein [uncultured Massilia sp.]